MKSFERYIVTNWQPYFSGDFVVFAIEQLGNDGSWTLANLSKRQNAFGYTYAKNPQVFYGNVSHQVVKEFFWHVYKVDIDRLPTNKRITKINIDEYTIEAYERLIKANEHGIAVFKARIKQLKEK